MQAIEVKAFVPAKDFEQSIAFYRDLGFEIENLGEDLACLSVGNASFLLQRFYVQQHAENFMMHLLVEDVESWWQRVKVQRLAERYRVLAEPPQDRPWGMRDFVLADPTGVLWRIGQNLS